jgi:hypothetical protein
LRTDANPRRWKAQAFRRRFVFLRELTRGVVRRKLCFMRRPLTPFALIITTITIMVG